MPSSALQFHCEAVLNADALGVGHFESISQTLINRTSKTTPLIPSSRSFYPAFVKHSRLLRFQHAPHVGHLHRAACRPVKFNHLDFQLRSGHVVAFSSWLNDHSISSKQCLPSTATVFPAILVLV